MELRHLRYFVVLAETCHFGQAAERLKMAQPPLSQQIRQLEAELGTELFARTTRSVSLTPAGEAFLADAQRILSSVEEAARRARRFADGKAGTLRIGLTGTASYTQLPVLARLVKEQLPEVVLDIHTEMLTPAIELALAAGELDVGVLRPPVRDPALEVRPIAREKFVVALPDGHRLAAADSLTIGELRAEDFIMYPAGSRSVVHEAVIRACRAADFYPRVAHESAKTLHPAVTRRGRAWRRRPAGISPRHRPGRRPIPGCVRRGRRRAGAGLVPHRPVAADRLVPRHSRGQQHIP